MNLLQMKMLQQVEVRSRAKRSTRLSSAVRVAMLYGFAVTLSLQFGDDRHLVIPAFALRKP
jgi:hypothetical protein